jgi:tetratricopeptide (TPR) repeat protein
MTRDRPTLPGSETVATVAETLYGEAAAGNRDAVQALIDGAFGLLDRGLSETARPVIEALDRLQASGLLAPVDIAWLFNLKAREGYSAGALDDALRVLLEALDIATGVHDRSLTATTLLNVGNVHWLRGNLVEAEGAFRSSLEALPRDAEFGRAQALLNLAGVRLDAEDTQGARSELARVSHLRPARRGRLRASVVGVRGLIAVADGDPGLALGLFRESANIASRVGALDHLIVALQNVGAVTLDLGFPGRAMRSLRRAERVALEINHFRLLDSIQRTLATALQRVGRDAGAQRVLERAEESARHRGDQAALARVLADAGALSLLRQRVSDAVPPLAEAVELFMALRDAVRAEVPLVNLATALTLLDEEERAVDEVRRAATSLEMSASSRSTIESALGDSLLAASRPEAAGRAYRRGSEAAEEAGTRSCDFLAGVAAKIGKRLPTEGVQYYTAALAAFTPPAIGVADYQILNDRALLLAELGRKEESVADLREALARATLAEDRSMRLMVLRNLSEVLRRDGQTQEATDLAGTALSEARGLGSPLEVASSLATLGLAVALGEAWEEAKSIFDESLRLARGLGAADIAAIAFGGLGEFNFRRGWFGRARFRYRQAADIDRATEDGAHLTESQAAIVETDALLGDNEEFDQDLQTLIDIVQKGGGTLDVAEVGISRAARAWMKKGPRGLQRAGETFAIGVLLALWGFGASGQEEPLREFGRAFVAPYVYSLPNEPSTLDELDGVILRTVEEKAGRRAKKFVREMLATGRAAAVAAFTDRR